MLLQGVMLLWFIQVALSVAFVAVDIRRTPESTVMKWGFVVVTLFLGVLGLVLYLLACREPLPGTHADYVRPLWKQVVGSTMHCVAGDGIGILVAAAILTTLGVPPWLEILGEYTVGFLFGWMVFQALFMRGMAGGSYGASLRKTLLPEFVSMNGVMAGMVALSMPWRAALGELATPAHPEFWFVMSLSLTLGFLIAFPLNWWLVSKGLKHGMMTVTKGGAVAEPGMAMDAGSPADAGAMAEHAAMEGAESNAMAEHAMMQAGQRMAGQRTGGQGTMHMPPGVSVRARAAMVVVSLVVLAVGVAIGLLLAR